MTLYCCMCGEELSTITIGGLIRGDWINFISKNVNEAGHPVDAWFCNECWLKLVEIRNR